MAQSIKERIWSWVMNAGVVTVGLGMLLCLLFFASLFLFGPKHVGTYERVEYVLARVSTASKKGGTSLLGATVGAGVGSIAGFEEAVLGAFVGGFPPRECGLSVKVENKAVTLTAPENVCPGVAPGQWVTLEKISVHRVYQDGEKKTEAVEANYRWPR